MILSHSLAAAYSKLSFNYKNLQIHYHPRNINSQIHYHPSSNFQIVSNDPEASPLVRMSAFCSVVGMYLARISESMADRKKWYFRARYLLWVDINFGNIDKGEAPLVILEYSGADEGGGSTS
jgi:hypothetical protein